MPPGRPDLLCRALGYLIDNPAEAARLGAAGRARIGEELSPAALGAVLDETYGQQSGARHDAPLVPLEVVAS